jgi:hypothetical protein
MAASPRSPSDGAEIVAAMQRACVTPDGAVR